MENAKSGDTVKIHYTGRLPDGTVFDSSRGREPLSFTLGAGQVVPGFERAVMGMGVGESKESRIPAEDAYGERRPDLIVEVPRTNFPPDVEPEVGMGLAINNPGRPPLPVTVAEVRDESVVLDANHPLAGKDLIFDIELVGVE